MLVGLLLSARGDGGVDLSQIGKIVSQLLLPFIAGQILRPKVGAFVHKHKKILSITDRGSILLVVYSAFSAAVVNGVWQRLSGHDLVVLLILDSILLALVLCVTTLAARALGEVGGRALEVLAPVFQAGVHGAHQRAVAQGVAPGLQRGEQMGERGCRRAHRNSAGR